MHTVCVCSIPLNAHAAAYMHGPVHTGDKVEFDRLLRSTLSPKLNMFNLVDFIESGRFFCRRNVARMSNVLRTLSPVCAGPNGWHCWWPCVTFVEGHFKYYRQFRCLYLKMQQTSIYNNVFSQLQGSDINYFYRKDCDMMLSATC